MSFKPINTITPFPLWANFTPTLPSLYWDVDSYEERMKRLCMELHKLVEYAGYLGENIELDHGLIKELQEEFEKFKGSGFLDYYIDMIQKWIDENMATLIRRNMGIVYPALTEDGRFVLYSAKVLQLTFEISSLQDDSYGRLYIKY